MSLRTRQIAAIAGGVLLVAVVGFLVLNGGAGQLPGLGKVLAPETCPLNGLEPKSEALLDRPAVAVKIENNPDAYPLSGLGRAEIVYEELVEGGLTRFMAIYHCTDAKTAGPVRSARIVDPAIMSPITRILGAAGANAIVDRVLRRARIVVINEVDAGNAMRRVPRPGVALEHTLYGNTRLLRKLGKKRFDDPPPADLFNFGDLEGRSKKASSITINFTGSRTVRYEWKGGKWLRFEGEEPLIDASGKQISVDNVIVEQHVVNYAKGLSDVIGSQSIDIADVVGSGRAVLFRDGRAIKGRWIRESRSDPVVFQTKAGDDMVLHPGTTWIELVPSGKGQVKGSFSFSE